MATLNYFPDAIATPLGQAHPLTGEQLDAVNGLADSIGYFKPNAKAKSFIDPNCEESQVAYSVVNARRASIAIHTLKSVKSVSQSFADGTATVIGGEIASHVFPIKTTDATYNVTATVTFDDDSTSSVSIPITIDKVLVAS